VLLAADTTTWPAVFRWPLPGPGGPFVSPGPGKKQGQKLPIDTGYMPPMPVDIPGKRAFQA